MKKLLLGLTLIFPLQSIAADDSVYSWGDWAKGIKPAAGPSAPQVTPSPVSVPNFTFRETVNPRVPATPAPAIVPTESTTTGNPRSRGR